MVDILNPSPAPEAHKIRPRTIALNGLFVMAIVLAVYVAKPVLLPVAFSLLLSMIVYPIHWRLTHRLHVPEQVSAAIILIGLIAVIAWSASNLTGPAMEWFKGLPKNIDQIQVKVQRYRSPMSKVSEVAEKIDELSKMPTSTAKSEGVGKGAPANAPKQITRPPAAKPTPAPAEPIKVKVATGGIGETVASNVSQFGIHFATTIILMFFMLAYGDVINRRLASRSRALSITREISSSVSIYLFTVTIINAGLGLCVGIAMYLLGMPNPVLWGVLAAVVNYVPYLGALVGIITVSFVAVLTFDHIGHIIAVPLSYFIIASIEGSFITPMILGNRFTLNPIFIFIWLLFWGWFWGIPGGVIAMPLLMAFKIVCDHFKSMELVSDMISLDPRRRWRIHT